MQRRIERALLDEQLLAGRLTDEVEDGEAVAFAERVQRLQDQQLQGALDETERFMTDLRRDLEGVANPVDRLAVYIRAQIEDLTRRHLPPGPTMRTVLSPEDYQKLGEHVGELQGLLAAILRDAIGQAYLPEGDISELAALVHGSLTAAADRGQNSDQDRAAREQHIRSTVRFIQQGLGAQFDAEGHPVPLASERPPLSAAS